jgi:starch synthase (maltosyl-transferring)
MAQIPTRPADLPLDGRARVIIEQVEPEADGGRYPIKRIVGERVAVKAAIYGDGHDSLSAVLRYRRRGEPGWQEVPMQVLNSGLDLWQGEFWVTDVGLFDYTLQAWVDDFKSWRKDFAKKAQAGQDLAVDFLTGLEHIQAAADRASGQDKTKLLEWRKELAQLRERDMAGAIRSVLGDERASLIQRHSSRQLATTYSRELQAVVDRPKALFSSWYEMFPRSCTPDPNRHATFEDCEKRLPYVAGMGFDVLYFPPIHPIGRSFRKGRNNNPVCGPADVGSPWAIGAAEGGHRAVHPKLGTLKDFRRLVDKARELGIEIALDIAFQCSPDHPWVKEHPKWFRWRPDGTVQYAENPPKKYEDIYPLNFESEDWQGLWQELRSVFLFWAEQGVRIFRVDNPHTKPFAFWEWVIAEVKSEYPDALFLAEAFTRPKVMDQLAKLGFTQSYTYFAWRNTKQELTDYFTELSSTPMREYFRPSLWPNTPDILTEYLQSGGRPAFMARLLLAGTLGSNFGIYGPAFELCENRPKSPGSEEYLNSEKYEIRAWDIDRPDSLKGLITGVNRARKQNPAFQGGGRLRFHAVDNGELIAYSKATDDLSNVILTVVNLDPIYKQSGWVELPLEELGLDPRQPYQVHDLLTGARYLWHGPRNYVELDPHVLPGHIFQVRRRLRTERDFDYFT